MTVTTATSRIEYAGDGSTTAFSVPFYFLANGDLKVYQADTLKTITTHYTVTGAGNPAGGTVTFVAAPGSSDDVVIYRDPAITQSTDYVENDPFPAESHETALDRLTMIAQRSRDLLTRAVRLPDSEADAASMTLPEKASRLSHVIGFDTLGNLTTYTAQAGTSLIDLAASTGSDLIGFIQSGTGAVLRTAQDKMRESVSVKDFGAVADGDGVGGGTDNSASIQAAIDAVVATGEPGVVYIPSGTYCCDTGLVLDLSLCSIEGDGAILDFTNMPGGTSADYTLNGFNQPLVGVALTVTSSYGYAGGAYYEATQRVRGIRLKGKAGVSEGGTPPAAPNDQTGIYLYGTTYTQTAALFENVAVSQFYQGAIFGENEFGSTFLNCTFVFCANCVYMPQVNNAGERNTFVGCTFYNSVNGLVLENAFSTTRLYSCSVGGMTNVYVYITVGFLSIADCHFEGNFAPDYPNAIMIWNGPARFPEYSNINISGTHFLAKSQRNNPVIKLDGAVWFNMDGGYIEGSTAGSAAVIGDIGTAAGSMKLTGTYVLNGTNAVFGMTSALFTYGTINLGNSGVFALGRTQPNNGMGIAFPATQIASTDANTLDDYEEGTFSPTIIGFTTAGTVTYVRREGYYTKIGNRVLFSIDVIWNTGTGTGDLGVSGLPFASSAITMLKAIEVIGDAISLTAGSYLQGSLLSINATSLSFIQSATGAANMSSVPYDAAGQLSISGQYFI